MRSISLRLFAIVSVFLSSGRRVSSLDLRLDIAGGTCHNTTEFDDTFDDGIMPGTEEVMDITTETLNDEAVRRYGYSAFRGGDLQIIDFQMHADEEQGHLRRRRQKEEERDLLPWFDCPVFKECPGAGDPTHWCAWICGYWQQAHKTSSSSTGSSSGPTSESSFESSTEAPTEPPTSPSERRGDGFLRRVTEDLRIPDAELQQLDQLDQLQALEPIRYTPQDRQLWISIEGLVCGWIQRWLDSGLSQCLHGATLVACELDLRS